MHKSWQELVKLAPHYLAIGEPTMFLYEGEFPWQYVVDFEVGGSHRMEIDTSLRFNAHHPSGMIFSWLFDIEGPEANGQSTYMIDIDGCRKVAKLLKGETRRKFAEYLRDCARKVSKQGDLYRQSAETQFKAADDLMKAAKQ